MLLPLPALDIDLWLPLFKELGAGDGGIACGRGVGFCLKFAVHSISILMWPPKVASA